jgi:hypothetical protein
MAIPQQGFGNAFIKQSIVESAKATVSVYNKVPPDSYFNRKLEERSYLRFEFYESGKESPHVRYLLFYEDPEIRESRKAIHAKYQPVGRNSTLMSFTGAESRVFSINFKMTLPHILAYGDTMYMNRSTPFKSKEELRKEFTKSFGDSNDPKIEALLGKAEDHDRYFLDLNRDYEPVRTSPEDFFAPPLRTSPEDFFNPPRPVVDKGVTEVRRAADNLRPQITKAIDLIMYWVNLVRVSILNNAKNPTNGPPIIRLNHGIMYQDVPCVALDYKIDYDKNHGYDLKTLLPRVISFEINLQEIRVGDFGEFDVKQISKRDNSVGWEAMVGNINTIDPIRLDIGTDYKSRRL